MVWIEFLICAAIVVFAGTKLSKYGDAIAEKTSLTGAWVGLLLLATITSMPELVAGASSVAVVDPPQPNLTIGMVMGSNLFNLMIIGLLDLQYRRSPLLAVVSRQHIISAGLCVLIIGIAGISIFISDDPSDWSINRVGISSIILLISYFISLKLISGFEQKLEREYSATETLNHTHISLRRTYLNFTITGLVIIGASIWLATIGDEIADVTGWEASFVGSLFLAVISSLPELAVCTAAVKIGAIDMAIADVLGSNMFNTGIIIAISDLFFGKGALLSVSSTGLGWTAIIAIVMTGIVVLGILVPAKRKLLRVASWEVPLLIALWAIGAYVLFVS